jgi:type I restriction enzyme M protein
MGGRIAIVLPDGILNNKDLKYVRDYIKKHTIIEAVISLPDRTFKAGGANSKCSILFLKKKHNIDEINPPVFMGIAEYIGFETKTKNAQEIDKNDLIVISQSYKESCKIASETLTNNPKKELIELSVDPVCFFIQSNLLEFRIDACYFYASFIYKLDREWGFVHQIAKVVKNNINWKHYSNDEEFNYLQFSNIDTKSGFITGFEIINQSNAPSRAKQMVKKGDVICARVKDSEENIAIIPDIDNIIVSTGFVVFRAIPPMTSEALYILLRQKSNLLQVRYKSTGTIMPSISADDYKNNIVPKLTSLEIENISNQVKIIEDRRNEIRLELNQIIENC